MEQLLEYFKPKNYKLSLFIDKESEIISGEEIISGVAKTEKVILHAVDMKIKDFKINDAKVPFEYDKQIITANVKPADSIKISLKFEKKLNKNMQGAYLSTYKHGKKIEKIVSTQFESHYAREAFPCVDEPAAKATFDLAITLPEGADDVVLANTPVAKKEGTTTIFETTPRMSTYLLAFVIGKFQGKSIKNSHGTMITTYAPLNQSPDTVDFANEVAARSLEFYDNTFEVPYPLEKLDQIAIPDFEAGAMENWGLVTYRESMLLADKTATKDTKKSIALTVAHELSHQWFGDLVTMKWWDDLWLNESFATMMEYLAVDSIYPDFNIWEDFFTGDCLAALSRDAYLGVQSVYQPVATPAEIATLFDGAIVYAKGARLMLMLMRTMGKDEFMAGLKNYFKAYRYANTVGDDLWNSLQQYASFNVKEFMHAWISQPGYPVLTDDKQQRFLLSGEDTETTWPLPKITDDMSGHFLINLSEKEFAEKLDDFDNLSLEQRLRLLIDRMFLAKTSLVSSASLLDLLPKFKDETSSSVWEIISRIIGHLKVFFTPDTPEDAAFKKYVQDLIAPNLKRLGLFKKASDTDDDVRLRKIINGLDYYAYDVKNLQKLADKYDSDYAALEPETRNDIIDAKLRLDEKTFDEILKKYQTVSDPEIKAELRFALGLTQDEKNIDKLISLLGDPEIIKPQDHLYLFLYAKRNHKASDKALDWLINNWQYVEKMTGEKSLEDYPRYAASTIKTKEEADKFFAFFDQFKDNPVLARALVVARTEIESKLTLIEQDQPAVYDKINQI